MVDHYKVVFLGETSVGKSSIVMRFVRDEFLEAHEPTIGAAFLSKTIKLDDGNVKMEIWDTAGQERYRSLAPMYYRGAKAAFVVYDITNKDSFIKAKDLINEVIRNGDPDVIIVLFGNKIDMQQNREVEREEGISYAEEHGFIFSEISAKTSENIQDAIVKVSIKLLERKPTKPRQQDPFTKSCHHHNNNKCC
jgi:small GTP-binding protein